MTMPTIEARKRHAHRVNGKFAKRPDALPKPPSSGDKGGPVGWREHAQIGDRRRYANDAAYLDDDDHLRFPQPPQPWGEPPERETWTDWRGAARCTAFCIAAGVAFAALSLLAVSAVFGIDAVALVRGAL